MQRMIMYSASSAVGREASQDHGDRQGLEEAGSETQEGAGGCQTHLKASRTLV